MILNNIPSGENIPNDIYVIIEIAANSTPVKYEIDKISETLFVDRFIPTTMFYPCNYGYINHTISSDGDPVDVLVPTPYPLQPGSVIRCSPVGQLIMSDEKGQDAKIIAVPHHTLSIEYIDIIDIIDIPNSLKMKILHFFKHYKDHEDNKWVNIENWGDAKSAKDEILLSIERAKKNKYL